jgi:hypothetical protein
MADAFPSKSSEFKIRSTPIFLLSSDGESEVVGLTADMRVRTHEAKQGKRGKREVDVEVLEWTAKGKSRLAGHEITLHLEGNQPRSFVTAHSFEGDFPARLNFRMNWAIEAAGERLEQLEGQAIGTINAFPPKRGDRFEMIGKDVAIGNLKVLPVACICGFP